MDGSFTADLDQKRRDQRAILWGLVLALDYGAANQGPFATDCRPVTGMLPRTEQPWPTLDPDLHAEYLLRSKYEDSPVDPTVAGHLSELGRAAMIRSALEPHRNRFINGEHRDLIEIALKRHGTTPELDAASTFDKVCSGATARYVFSTLVDPVSLLVSAELVAPDNSLGRLWLLRDDSR